MYIFSQNVQSSQFSMFNQSSLIIILKMFNEKKIKSKKIVIRIFVLILTEIFEAPSFGFSYSKDQSERLVLADVFDRRKQIIEEENKQ